MCNLGRYVEYKHRAFIVVKEDAKQVHINSPEHGRLKVNKTSVKRMHCPDAKIVHHTGVKYIVTAKGIIFSNASGRIMNWPDNHGTRKYIMEKASCTSERQRGGTS
jgi:GH43 family beta-xylosidase